MREGERKFLVLIYLQKNLHKINKTHNRVNKTRAMENEKKLEKSSRHQKEMKMFFGKI